ncbi:hypothetical protein [Deinococcus sonorensis]|uniref:Uncharacterized protein n=2 Tax=Deinococcus sonorensis TaxID=309891 RepID=A0AAU7U7N1_9DEIO
MTPIQDDLREVNIRFRSMLLELSSVLYLQGIRRIHYGLDFIDDDSRPSDYAVTEYLDGRVEEQDRYPELLSPDVFVWGVKYCQPYTFDVASALLQLDEAGGSVEVRPGMTCMYHSQKRRLRLELEAEQDLSGLCFGYHDDFDEAFTPLRDQGITAVYFGVNRDGDRYPLADWVYVARQGQPGTRPAPEHRAALEQIREVIELLPRYGAFYVDTAQLVILDAPPGQGGLVTSSDTQASAWHTEQQRQALERQHTAGPR